MLGFLSLSCYVFVVLLMLPIEKCDGNMAYTVITRVVASIVKASVVPLSIVVTIQTPSRKKDGKSEIEN